MHDEIDGIKLDTAPARGDVLEVGELIGYRYRVQRSGHSHPLGALYLCHDETVDRLVLLQRLRREFASPQVRDRLFEARASAALEVAAIAEILDYGEDLDGRPFLVTAHRDDASLAEIECPLSFRVAVAIVERVAAALEPVHRKHLAHGGIEPSSVLIDDKRELTGLLGFGLVPALELGATKARALPLLVSPAYAAPELIRAEPMSPAADVYALGILLWELMFGAPPFRGPTLRVLDSHLNRALPEIELPFDAPASFESILRRMLAKQPSDRFADAGEVAAQLRAYASPGQDEAATTVLERELELGEDSWLVVPVIAREFPGSPPLSSFELPPRRAPKRLAALAGLTCAVLLIWGLGAGSFDSFGAAAEASSDSLATEIIKAAAAERAAVVVGAVQAGPAPSVPEAPAIESTRRGKLSTANLRSRKAELYRRVEQRCVEGRMRRTIKLAVRVGPTGAVEAASVVGGMRSTKIGRCVRRQAKQLRFPATRTGGSYTYTIRIR
jgi:eukaryotic-like serine/threonine-protein kinase